MVAAAGIVCQGQPKAGLALQQKHRNVSWTHFKALVKGTTFVNNNFKNAASYLESSLQPMKVPGREQLQNGRGMSHQRQRRIQDNHTHHGCKKKTKAGRNKRISQKLQQCASCGVMPWTRWIGPNPGSWKKHKG